jgi:hypothetical protein
VATTQVRAYFDAQVVQGTLDVRERRVSDFINDPNVSLLMLEQATWQDMLAATDSAPGPAELARVRKEMARIVIPYDSPSVLAPRLTTVLVPVHIGLGLFTVDGMIHRREGDTSEVDQQLRGASRLFLPATQATIRYGPNGGFDIEVPVALVNTSLIQYWTGPRG